MAGHSSLLYADYYTCLRSRPSTSCLLAIVLKTWMPGTSPSMTKGETFCNPPKTSARLLHRDLRFEARDIAIDRRHREHAAATLVPYEAILPGDVAVDGD